MLAVGHQQHAVEACSLVDVVERDERSTGRLSTVSAQDLEQSAAPNKGRGSTAARRAAAGAAAAPGPGRAARVPARRSTAGRPGGRQVVQARADRSSSSTRRGIGPGRPSAITSRAAIGHTRSRDAGRKVTDVAGVAPAADRRRSSPSMRTVPAAGLDAGQRAQQAGLAAAVRADQRDQLPAGTSAGRSAASRPSIASPRASRSGVMTSPAGASSRRSR